MKRLSLIIIIGLLTWGLTASGCVHRSGGQADTGWITLFDGTNVDHGTGSATLIGGWRMARFRLTRVMGIWSRRIPTQIFRSGPSSGLIPLPTAASSYAVPIRKRSAPKIPTR